MSYIITPSRRLQQPRGPLKIAWNNPITRGLMTAFQGRSQQDPVSGVLGIPGTRNTFNNGALSGTGAGTNFTVANAGVLLGSSVKWSSYSLYRPRTVVSRGGIWAFNDEIGLAQGYATAHRVYVSTIPAWHGYSYSYEDSDNFFVAGETIGIGANSDAIFYRNGQRIFQGVGAAGSQSLSTTTIKYLGGGGSNFISSDGELFCNFVWARYLSEKEHSAIHANPDQLFERSSSRTYFDQILNYPENLLALESGEKVTFADTDIIDPTALASEHATNKFLAGDGTWKSVGEPLLGSVGTILNKYNYGGF